VQYNWIKYTRNASIIRLLPLEVNQEALPGLNREWFNVVHIYFAVTRGKLSIKGDCHP